jgi:hypothetical protein
MSDVLSIFKLKYVWQPKEDITTHELALCIPSLCRAMSVAPLAAEQMVDALPENAKRHFLPPKA